MSNEILNEELGQIKYLFDYKAGRVISEQNVSPEITPKEVTPEWKIKLTNNPQDLSVFMQTGSPDLKPAGLLNKAFDDYEKTKDRAAYTATYSDIAALVKPMLTMAFQNGLDGTKFKQLADDKIIQTLDKSPKPEGVKDWNMIIEQQFSNISNLKNLVGNLIDIKIKNLG